MGKIHSKDETKELMKRVLQAYVRVGVIGMACDYVGITRKMHLAWLDKYPSYRERFNELKEQFVDGIEYVAIQRAKEKSDSLLITLLKAHRREVYGDKTDINHSGGINHAPIQLLFAEGMLNEEEKKMLTETKSEE